MTPLGKLVRSLRQARGLSQKALADLAGLTQITITRIESSSAALPHKSTLMHVYNGFNSCGLPLSGAELEQFVNVSGLSGLLWRSGAFTEGNVPSLSPQAAFYASLSEPEGALVRRVLQLAQELGVDVTLSMLDTVAALATKARQPQPRALAASPRTLAVHSPLKPGPAGSVEQVITDYEVVPATPAQAAPARRKATKRRA